MLLHNDVKADNLSAHPNQSSGESIPDIAKDMDHAQVVDRPSDFL
jgi:hypothetical protein